MPYLPPTDLLALQKALIEAHHDQDGTWAAALSMLMPQYRAILPAEQTGPKILITLGDLNTTSRLVDGTIPMQVVLGSLRLLTPVAPLNHLAAKLLAKVEGVAGLGASTKPVSKRHTRAPATTLCRSSFSNSDTQPADRLSNWSSRDSRTGSPRSVRLDSNAHSTARDG